MADYVGYAPPYDFLQTRVCIQSTVQRPGTEYEQNLYDTVQRCVNAAGNPQPADGNPLLDGEGNVIGTAPFYYLAGGHPLSADSWALAKMGPYSTPDDYDWNILGDFRYPQLRGYLFGILESLRATGGLPSGYDWTPCLVAAAKQYWGIAGRPFSEYEMPALFVPYYAALCAGLPDLAAQIAPGTAAWDQSLAEAHARRDAAQASSRAVTEIAVAAALSFGAAAYFAPAAAASPGAAAAAPAAGASTLAPELTAEQYAAGLTAEQIAGTAALPAALEAAPAVVSSVESAPALAPELTAEEYAAGLAPAEISGAAPLTSDVLASLPASEASTVQSVMSKLGVQTLASDAGKAVVAQLVTMGKSALASELMQAIGGGGGAAPGLSADQYAAGLSPSQIAGGLPPSGFAATLAKAKPALIGASLGLLGLFFLSGNDNRKKRRRHVRTQSNRTG
ncbi:MAG: hypothetical protein ACREDH_12215 [Methylocella sp.]